MDIYAAAEKLRRIAYKPGWTFRFDTQENFGVILMTAWFKAQDSSVEHASLGYPKDIVAEWNEVITVLPETSEADLYSQVFAAILTAELHESSEFFRVTTAGRAPFHAHKDDGQAMWNLRGPEIVNEVLNRTALYLGRETTTRARQAAAREQAVVEAVRQPVNAI